MTKGYRIRAPREKATITIRVELQTSNGWKRLTFYDMPSLLEWWSKNATDNNSLPSPTNR